MKMELQHFSHKDHPLILKEVQEDESGRIICNGCEKPILEDSMYSCDLCDFFLHKRCAELPQEIYDPLHSQHLLTLYAYSPYPSPYLCDACRNVLNRFNYFCFSCKFNVCVSCFLEERTIMHTSHEHPLAVISRQALFNCNVCGTESKDLSFMCHPCGFWIHKTCALSPPTITHSNHPHPLALVKQHFKLTNFAHFCDLCGLFIIETCWAYYCGPCRYFVHLKCATLYSESVSGGEDENKELYGFSGGEDENKVCELLDSNVIHLPMIDGFGDFIKKFVEQLDLEEREREAEVTYFSHEHPLTLSDVQGHNEIKDEKILCNCCVQPISSPFYSCSHCNYFLHLSCINLPVELQHPSHLEHPLCLFSYMKIYHTFECNLCGAHSNGFFYGCLTCYFFVDIKCACLVDNDAYAHKAHKHPLFRSEGLEYCNACGRLTFPGIRFGCDKCKFYICTQCIVLPHIISHRWDKHPLTLSYPPYYDHPDEFHCEYCEDEINPKSWIYHCCDCDQSFHPRCIENIQSNIKSSGNVQIIDHPHRLMFLKKKNPYSNCCKCGKDDIYFLKCLECNYTICTYCCDRSFKSCSW